MRSGYRAIPKQDDSGGGAEGREGEGANDKNYELLD